MLAQTAFQAPGVLFMMVAETGVRMGLASADEGSAFTVRLARDADDLRAAQHLRYRVFIEEMGGDGPLVDHIRKLECDSLDPVVDHLLLIDRRRDPQDGAHVIGAYRLLPDTRLSQAGRFYCDSEFDLAPLRQSGRKLLELGRSCIDPAYRGGGGMLLMWQGLADYVQARDIGILFGAASFHGIDPTAFAQALGWLHHHHLAPQALRVRSVQRTAFCPLPKSALDPRLAMQQMPSLIRAYLRVGGKIGDGVYIDPDFRTTDVCVILDTQALSAHARSFAARSIAGLAPS